MPDKKLPDSEIVKACKDCLHYEACKGTYYSAKGDEDILHDFDGEMYANSGCEDYKDKDLINRLQAENERLKEKAEKCFYCTEQANKKIGEIKAEAYKEFAERLKKEAFKINYCGSSYDVVDTDDIDNLLKELVGEDNG